MECLEEIIARRSPPGILVFDWEIRLLYSNEEALDMIAALRGGVREEFRVPQEVYDLCGELKGGRKAPGAVLGVIRQAAGAGEGLNFSLRAFLLGDHGGGNQHTHIMAMMERVVESRRVDVEKARTRYHLSRRETEVLGLICQGLANKEISGSLFVSEFTVKDHIKSIMRKMGAVSRNEIIAFLL